MFAKNESPFEVEDDTLGSHKPRSRGCSFYPMRPECQLNPGLKNDVEAMKARRLWVRDAVEQLRRESRRAVGKPIIRADGLAIDWILDYGVNRASEKPDEPSCQTVDVLVTAPRSIDLTHPMDCKDNVFISAEPHPSGHFLPDCNRPSPANVSLPASTTSPDRSTLLRDITAYDEVDELMEDNSDMDIEDPKETATREPPIADPKRPQLTNQKPSQQQEILPIGSIQSSVVISNAKTLGDSSDPQPCLGPGTNSTISRRQPSPSPSPFPIAQSPAYTRLVLPSISPDKFLTRVRLSPKILVTPRIIGVPSQTSRTVFLPVIPLGTKPSDLEEFFSMHIEPEGRPLEIRIPPNDRLIAYVHFKNSSEAESAILKCDGKMFREMRIRVKRFKTVAQMSSSSSLGKVPARPENARSSSTPETSNGYPIILASQSCDGPPQSKRRRTFSPPPSSSKAERWQLPSIHHLSSDSDEKYETSSSSETEDETRVVSSDEGKTNKIFGRDPLGKALISVKSSEPSTTVELPKPLQVGASKRCYTKARRLLVFPDMLMTVAIRGDLEVIDRTRRQRMPRYSLPRRPDSRDHVVDACMIGEHTAVIGYYNSQFQASLVNLGKKTVRLDLSARPHIVSPDRTICGVSAVCGLDNSPEDGVVRFISGGHDRTVLVWSVDESCGTVKTSRLPTFHTSYISALAYNHAKGWLFSGGADRRFCVVDVAAEKNLVNEKLTARGIIQQLHVHPEKPNLLFWEVDNYEQVLVFDIRTTLTKPIATLGPPQSLFTTERPAGRHVRGSCYLNMFVRRAEVYDVRNNRQVIDIETPWIQDIKHSIVDTTRRPAILHYGKNIVSYFDFSLL